MQSCYGASSSRFDLHHSQAPSEASEKGEPLPSQPFCNARPGCESNVLHYLRKIEAQLRSADDHTIASPQRELYQRDQDCLLWHGKHLEWSRNETISRTFTFDAAITDACWAVFETENRASVQQATCRSGGAKLRLRHTLSPLTPAQATFRANLAGEANPEDEPNHGPSLRGEALVVSFRNSLWIHHPVSGMEYRISTDFTIERICPMRSGIILQSAEAHRSDPRSPGVYERFHFFGSPLAQPTAAKTHQSASNQPRSRSHGCQEQIIRLSNHGTPTGLVLCADQQKGVVTAYRLVKGGSAPRHQASGDRRRPTPVRVSAHPMGGDTIQLQGVALNGENRNAKEFESSLASPKHRRRSSRLPHYALDPADMTRIEESFMHTHALVNNAPASIARNNTFVATSGAQSAAAEQCENAAEAEEVGQIVHHVSRRRQSQPGPGGDENVTTNPMRPLHSALGQKLRPRRTSRRATVSAAQPIKGRLGHSRARASIDFSEPLSPVATSPFDALEKGIDCSKRSSIQSHVQSQRAHCHDSSSPVMLPLCVIDIAPSETEGHIDALIITKNGNQFVLIHHSDKLHLRSIDTSGKTKQVVRTMAGIKSIAAPRDELGHERIVGLSKDGLLLVDLSSAADEVHFVPLYLKHNQHPGAKKFALSFEDPWPSSSSVPITSLRTRGGNDLILGRDEECIVVQLPRLGAAEECVEKVLSCLESFESKGGPARASFLSKAAASTCDVDALSCTLMESDDPLLIKRASADVFGLLPPVENDSSTQHTVVQSNTEAVQKTLWILHAAAQDLRLDCLQSASILKTLVGLITRLASNTSGNISYCNYWSMIAPSEVFQSSQASKQGGAQPSSDDLAIRPLDVFEMLTSALKTRSTVLLPNCPFNLKERDLMTLMPRAHAFWRILRIRPDAEQQKAAMQELQTQAGRPADLQTLTAANIVEGIASAGQDRLSLEKIPVALALPIYAALHQCSNAPLENITRSAAILVGRLDCVSVGKLPTHGRQYSPKSTRSYPAGSGLDPLSAMLFPHDYRLREVVNLLCTHRVRILRAPAKPDKSEDEVRELGLGMLHNAAEKIKAASIGRGMLFLLTKVFDPTQRWVTPPLNRRILLRPPQHYHLSEPRPDSLEMEWPEFHNGTASALEMIVAQDKVESIWYFAQSAGERNPRHAGLLLGLGLAGRFASIGQVHTYRYLGDRHDLTSIGLLLGLSATFLGRGDPDVRALLACHVKAFLPQHSANLAHSTLVQAAALLGTGLLFMGTWIDHIAEALCGQIYAQELETTDSQMYCRNAYSLSAALATGLVLLGRGRSYDNMTSRQRRALCLLRSCISGPEPGLFQEGANDPIWHVDLRVTAVPAALAYGLIFLKSDNHKAADSIAFPARASDLDLIRPDALLMFSIARNLIMWGHMQPSQAWIDSQCPEVLRQRRQSQCASAIACSNITAGACFALSLKYAGTGDSLVKQLLMSQYNQLTARATSVSKHNYDGRVQATNMRLVAEVLVVAMAIVFAGSGDVDILKVLHRACSGQDEQSTYGHHMANHMALGLLFLGGGRHTLSSSDASVAALLIAFYPLYPTKSTDNRGHLQAYRHLWLLAVEPRLLVTQNIDTGEVESVPVAITNGDECVIRTTPLQLPAANGASDVRLVSDRHYSSRLGPTDTTRPFIASTMPIKLRDGLPNYSQDPFGYMTSALRQMKGQSSVAPLQYLPAPDFCPGARTQDTGASLTTMQEKFCCNKKQQLGWIHSATHNVFGVAIGHLLPMHVQVFRKDIFAASCAVFRSASEAYKMLQALPSAVEVSESTTTFLKHYEKRCQALARAYLPTLQPLLRAADFDLVASCRGDQDALHCVVRVLALLAPQYRWQDLLELRRLMCGMVSHAADRTSARMIAITQARLATEHVGNIDDALLSALVD